MMAWSETPKEPCHAHRPKGEKRPADAVAQAVMIGKLATGEAEEEYVDQVKSQSGRKGGQARAKSLHRKRRSQIGKEGATKR